MLILSRKAGEQIVIPELGVVITVLGGRGVVRVGVDAPKSVAVHRSEVWDRMGCGGGTPPVKPTAPSS